MGSFTVHLDNSRDRADLDDSLDLGADSGPICPRLMLLFLLLLLVVAAATADLPEGLSLLGLSTEASVTLGSTVEGTLRWGTCGRNTQRFRLRGRAPFPKTGTFHGRSMDDNEQANVKQRYYGNQRTYPFQVEKKRVEPRGSYAPPNGYAPPRTNHYKSQKLKS